VGAVGLIPDYAHRAGFKGLKAGDSLVLIGETRGEIGSSLYLRELLGREEGAPPPVDLALERKTGDFVRGLIRGGEARVVHDLSDGGLIAAAAEMALASGVGVTLEAAPGADAHFHFFGEDQARYLIATTDPKGLIGRAEAAGLPAGVAGLAGGEALASTDGLFSVSLAALRDAHEGWLPGYMA
jgi:phosphoribosylformylglycinamidine synthase